MSVTHRAGGGRVRALEGKTNHDFEVVVSRYREDISWAEPMWGGHATIYDKSGEPLTLDPATGRIPLPNIGREFGTYLHHIVTRWEILAERTLFLQGDPFVHRRLPWDAYVRSPGPFLMLYTDFWKMDEPFCWGPAGDGTRGSILVPDKYAWWRDVIQRVPTAEHSHTWGAQFAVDKSLIRRCGLEYWQRLYAFATSEGLVLDTRKKYTNYEIGIMFEFTWPQIMLGKGATDERGGMRDESEC